MITEKKEEKDIESRKKEGRYFTMQANSFDGEDLGNLVGEGLTYPDGVLLYCRSGNIEIYMKYYTYSNQDESKFYIEEKIDNILTKQIELDSICDLIKTNPGRSSTREFDKYPIDIIFNKESYPYIFILLKHNLKGDRELYSSNDDISLLMINLKKEEEKGGLYARDYQYLKLASDNESINFDSKDHVFGKTRFLKDIRKNVLKLNNNGKLLMIQTQKGNEIIYHLITLLNDPTSKVPRKYMFYDRNLFYDFLRGDLGNMDYLILGYNFLNTYTYNEYGINEKMENIEEEDIKFLSGDILDNYYDLSNYNTGNVYSGYKLSTKILKFLPDFLESKKKKKCEMNFGIISIDNLGYYRVSKEIKLTFYDFYTYNADSKKHDFAFTFIKKDLRDIISVEEPLYSYSSSSIDAYKRDENALEKTSVKGDIINIDIGRTEKSKISNLISAALPKDRKYMMNALSNYRLENINIESNVDDRIIVFNPIFKLFNKSVGLTGGVGVLKDKIDIIKNLQGIGDDSWEYIYKVFQKVYSPKIVVTNLDSSITKIDFHKGDRRYFSLNHSTKNDIEIVEGNRILKNGSLNNKDFLENWVSGRRGCDISENPGFKNQVSNRRKNVLDYLIVAGNYLINLKIQIGRGIWVGDANTMNILIFKKGIDKDGKGDIMFHQIKCYNMELEDKWINSINDFKITEDLDINLMFLEERDKNISGMYKLDFKTNIDMDMVFDELSDLYKMKEKGNFGKYADGFAFEFNEPKKEEEIIELKKYTSKDLQDIENRLSKQKKQIEEKSNAEMRVKENAFRLKKGMLRNTEKEVAKFKKEKEEKIKTENALKDDIKKLRTRSPTGQIGRRTYIGKKTMPQDKKQGEYLAKKIKEYDDKEEINQMDLSEADPEGAKEYRLKKKKEREEEQEKKNQDSLEKKKAAAAVKKRRTQRKAAIMIQRQQRRHSATKKLKKEKEEKSYLNLLTQITPLKSTPERAVQELENNLALKKGIEERTANKEKIKSESKNKSAQIKKLRKTLKETLKEIKLLQSDDSSSGSQSSSLSSMDSDKL